MNKCDIAVEVLKRLNTLIKTLNENKTFIGNKLDKVKDKIELLKQQLKHSEIKLKEKIMSRNKVEESKHKIVYKHKKNKIYKILSSDVKSSVFKWHDLKIIPCKDLMNQIPLFEYIETRYVSCKDDLNDLNSSKYFLVNTFHYDQKTYNIFLCYISVLDMNGVLFIIDVLKYREDLIELGFLSCKFKKIFISLKAYYSFLNDFKSFTCYIICDFHQEDSIVLDNLSVCSTKKDNIMIDWRIRPIDNYMKFKCQIEIIQIISTWNKFVKIYYNQNIEISETFDKNEIKNYNQFSFAKMLNKNSDEYLQLLLRKLTKIQPILMEYQEQSVSESIVSGNTIKFDKIKFKITKNDRLVIQKDEDILLLRPFQKNWYGLIIEYLCHKYNLKTSTYLEKLVKHREHIAMDNNDSIFSIASDELIAEIYKEKPTNFDLFKDKLKDASPLLKSNFHGFLFSEKINEDKKKQKHIKSLKINKNKDIRGNKLEDKNYIRKKKNFNIPKFTYNEDSSDLELLDSPVRNYKCYKQKNKQMKVKIDTMLKTMDVKDKYKKKSEKKVYNPNKSSENKTEITTSEPFETLEEKKKPKHQKKKRYKKK